MPIRPLKLPKDINILTEIIPPSFQYPENPDWSFAEDETESFISTLKSFKRFWPLIKLVQNVSPAIRNIFRGYIWEEDGKPVGLVNCASRGNTDNWVIGNVAVLPEYRRRGIARKLVEAAIDLIKQADGDTITLDVISNNVPAYSLYKKLGFEHFSGEVELQNFADAPTTAPVLPQNQTTDPYDLAIWEPRYQLAKQIVPPENLKYQPVNKYHYKQPNSVLFLNPLINTARGVQRAGELIQSKQEDQLAGWWRAALRTRAGGVNQTAARVAPGDSQTAKYIIQSILHAAHTTSPDRRTLLSLPQWQTDLIHAALENGFETRLEIHRMGLVLDSSD